ncbi:hypothetical protein QLS71_004680 [Mariniflexile litorale]|uniref:Uncharacterized protein n=1 Tax=Mariniflexile litorale TaxID=3045158 RepID=A0AAU7EIL4_9FLAO|nr:hypothetical protein [Mariniflexile sp. KMM 9835]MDQ8210317.1 hypothetical protein [Mariniflexile sp. KMM 9835]
MKYVLHLFFFLSLSITSQESIETSLIEKNMLDANIFVSTNNFNTTFYILENVLFKHSAETKGLDIGYSNFQLGTITSVNTFNPLKINVFYKDFNTVLILDNRLAEIFKIDFNALSEYKNVTYVATGSDNTIWIFNENTQQLELFDYKTNTKRAQTLPFKSSILDIKSNYNYCWVLTKTDLYVYDYFGNLSYKMKNDGYESINIDNENVIFKKDNNLYYLKKNTKTIVPITLPNLLINQFFVTNETLYIYDKETLHKYQLKID